MENLPGWLTPEVIWFAVGLALMLAEFAMPGLIVFFFGIGAWVVALVCMVADIGFNTQLVVFLVSSILILVVFRKKLKSLFFSDIMKHKNLESTLEEYKGKRVKVTMEINPNLNGKVEFNGANWDAEAEVIIPEGTMVEVVEKNNLTLKVKTIS